MKSGPDPGTGVTPRTLGVVMDPIAQIEPRKDTTLGLLEAAQRKSWRLVYFEQKDLYLQDATARGEGRELNVSLDDHDWFRLGKLHDMALEKTDVILMRKDPPVDSEFLYTCQILEHVAPDKTLVINNPRAIRLANEKILAQRFADLTPPTLVSRNPRHIRRFLEKHGDTVVKPLDGMGGASVFRLRADEQNASVIIETSTRNGQQTVMVQKLISDYEKGDKRILMIDGEPVSFALRRLPSPGELRANLAAGGRGEATELDDRDRDICTRIKPVLKELGLLLVGLDIVGGYLTEVNITSPTCMRELNALCRLDIGTQVMDAIAHHLDRPSVQ